MYDKLFSDFQVNNIFDEYFDIRRMTDVFQRCIKMFSYDYLTTK